MAFKMAKKNRPSPGQLQLMSEQIRADRRTIRKVLDGKPVRGRLGAVIEEELQRRGWR